MSSTATPAGGSDADGGDGAAPSVGHLTGESGSLGLEWTERVGEGSGDRPLSLRVRSGDPALSRRRFSSPSWVAHPSSRSITSCWTSAAGDVFRSDERTSAALVPPRAEAGPSTSMDAAARSSSSPFCEEARPLPLKAPAVNAPPYDAARPSRGAPFSLAGLEWARGTPSARARSPPSQPQATPALRLLALPPWPPRKGLSPPPTFTVNGGGVPALPPELGASSSITPVAPSTIELFRLTRGDARRDDCREPCRDVWRELVARTAPR